MKRGDSGEYVKYLQIGLNYIADKKKTPNYAKLTPDGKFGLNTENALKRLYGVQVVSKKTAEQIGKDADIPQMDAVLKYFN